MSVKLTPKTKNENKVLREFLAAHEDAKRSITRLANAYKACVDAGIDMSRYVSKALAFRLQNIAAGRLLPEAHEKTLGNDAAVATLVMLSREQQKSIVLEGVKVWRDGKEVFVPLEDLRPSEARKIIDVTGGKARLLSAPEQAERQTPPRPRHDKIVQLRLTPEQFEALYRAAKKVGQSPQGFVIDQLYKAGVLPKEKPKLRRAA